jgi:tRNA G18 (ribose-2'-O)-methylase SpoU
MVTDKYLNMNYFPTVSDLADYCKKKGILVIGVDILQGISKPIENFVFPKNCVLLFGSESNGLSEEAQAICQTIVHITQFGSTRSINVGAAAAIAMFALSRQI